MERFTFNIQTRNIPKNTRRANEKAARTLRDYLKEKNMSPEFESLDVGALSVLLLVFYHDIRKRDGDQYKVTSLEGFRYSLNRYLKFPPHLKTFDIIKDEIFEEANSSFKEAVSELKATGKGEVTHHPVILDSDIDKLYSSLYFDTSTPLGLLNKVQFEIRMYFFRRGSQCMVEMTKKSFQVRADSESGYKYMCKSEEEPPRDLKTTTVSVCSLSPTTAATAANASTTDTEELSYIVERPADPNCPVKSFEKYRSKLHPLCHRLWQRPISSHSTDDRVWYRNSPVGRNTLQRFMPELSLACRLSQKYSNHSVRITGATKTALAGGYNFALPHGGKASRRSGRSRGETTASTLSNTVPRVPTSVASSTGNPQRTENTNDEDEMELKIISVQGRHHKKNDQPRTKLEKCLRWIEACGRAYSQLNVFKIDQNKYVCSKHFVGGNGPTRDHPDPLPVRPMNILQSGAGYMDLYATYTRVGNPSNYFILAAGGRTKNLVYFAITMVFIRFLFIDWIFQH